MAKLIAKVTRDASWADTDLLGFYIGSEGEADLASSTPAGGTLVSSLRVGDVETGGEIELSHEYSPDDKCASLPIGVTIRDEAGNESAADESLITLSDPPQGPGRPDIAATANPGEATLTWLASPDL